MAIWNRNDNDFSTDAMLAYAAEHVAHVRYTEAEIHAFHANTALTELINSAERYDAIALIDDPINVRGFLTLTEALLGPHVGDKTYVFSPYAYDNKVDTFCRAFYSQWNNRTRQHASGYAARFIQDNYSVWYAALEGHMPREIQMVMSLIDLLAYRHYAVLEHVCLVWLKYKSKIRPVRAHDYSHDGSSTSVTVRTMSSTITSDLLVRDRVVYAGEPGRLELGGGERAARGVAAAWMISSASAATGAVRQLELK